MTGSMRIDLKEAVKLLLKGGVVAIPTETVYGLAARLADELAIRKIFDLKGRPSDNPLIVHLAEVNDLSKVVKRVPATFERILKFWPGPLTVVLPVHEETVPVVARAGLPTVAVRVPDKAVTRELIRQVGPLVAPSANISGRPSATTAQHVEKDFGPEFPVLDDGPCAAGVESTVILLEDDGWQLLRHGAVTEEDLTLLLGVAQPSKNESLALSPGQKYRHYAPRCELVLCGERGRLESGPFEFSAVLGFDDTVTPLPLISLGRRQDFTENLRRLYAALRALDDSNFLMVGVDFSFLKTGLGATLAERLTKASKK